ncbi:MAG: hypothetical protein U1E23_01535 [Reyranellaceae bacterium]
MLGAAGAAGYLALLLGCLALAFPGGAPGVAIGLFLLGTLALATALARRAARTRPRPMLTVVPRGAPPPQAPAGATRSISTRLVL